MHIRQFLPGLLLLAPAVGRADWPEFRGPHGDGHYSAQGEDKPAELPLTWGPNENVRWKTPIPHLGWSTPVVLGGQVWLTTATPDGRDFFVIALDATTGRVLINKKLFHSDHPEPLGNKVNCYASPSPAIEPGRVYVHFGSYGTACLDTTSGEVVWQRTDLPCRHYRGPGSSLVLFNDYLIVTFDGIDLQYLTALDKKTGKTVWKTDRTADWNDLNADGKPIQEGDLRKAYSTPLITTVDGKPQMISAGAKAFYGYDPQTGREIWKVRHNGQGNAARPVVGHGLAFVSTGFSSAEMLAIRLGGTGDVTGTHIAWRTLRGASRMASPVLVGDLLYMLSDQGVVTCLEAVSGKEVWKERIGGDYAASMLYAAGRIYCCAQDGKTTVFEAGRQLKVLARNTLPNGFMSSPAASGKALYLRTRTDLYRIENTGAASPTNGQ
jgi:outer membrane protein assembly factor BamB